MRNTNVASPFGSLFTTVTAMVSPAHEVITRQPLYDAIPPLQLRPSIRSLASGIFGRIESWRLRHAQRKSLAMLDDRLLEDDGLSRQDVAEEADKPFWRS
ncbi:MAG: DUF1127 domain-containing protein [Alphaproteobacteria bacterium]|nr:DUF1127 domain-containing protein [Alphaproteobacteria bacterium]